MRIARIQIPRWPRFVRQCTQHPHRGGDTWVSHLPRLRYAHLGLIRCRLFEAQVIRLRHDNYVTTPPSGHPLEATPPFSSSLGKAKASFVFALAPSSNLKEGGFIFSSLLLPDPAVLTDCKKQLEEIFFEKIFDINKKKYIFAALFQHVMGVQRHDRKGSR